jgi:hypothetical protein
VSACKQPQQGTARTPRPARSLPRRLDGTSEASDPRREPRPAPRPAPAEASPSIPTYLLQGRAKADRGAGTRHCASLTARGASGVEEGSSVWHRQRFVRRTENDATLAWGGRRRASAKAYVTTDIKRPATSTSTRGRGQCCRGGAGARQRLVKPRPPRRTHRKSVSVHVLNTTVSSSETVR